LGKWSEALKICRDLSNRNDFKRNAELNLQLNFLTADIYYNQSNYSNSIKLLSKMSKTYTDNSDKYLEITGLLCLNYYESGNPNKAENYAKTFFNISSESNNKLNSAKAYEYFGLIERSKGNYKASVSYFQKSIDLFIQSKDLIKSAVLNNRVGINYLQLSEYKKSLEYFERCKVQTEKNGDIREYLNVIGNISVAYNAMGKNEQAFKICKKKIEFSRRIDYKEGIAGTLASIGNYYYDEKLYDNALNKYSEALKLFEEIEKKTSIANMNCNIALIHMHRGNFGEALKHFALQMKINENIKHKEGMYLGYVNMANLYKKINQNAQANKYYCLAINIANEIGSNLLKAIAQFNYAEFLFNNGELEKAQINIMNAMIVKDNKDYKKEIFHFKLLNNKINFYTELKKHTFLNKNNFLSSGSVILQDLISQTELLLNEASNDEEIAKVHYDLWDMKIKEEVKDMKAINHKKLALKYFKRIFKKTSDIEYQIFINELS